MNIPSHNVFLGNTSIEKNTRRMHTFRQHYKSTFLTIFKAMPSTKRTAVRQELTNSLPGVLP